MCIKQHIGHTVQLLTDKYSSAIDTRGSCDQQSTNEKQEFPLFIIISLFYHIQTVRFLGKVKIIDDSTETL